MEVRKQGKEIAPQKNWEGADIDPNVNSVTQLSTLRCVFLLITWGSYQNNQVDRPF